MEFNDERTSDLINAVIKVHQELGPGFLESIYQEALCIELEDRGHRVDREHEVRVFYLGREVGVHRLDILVDGNIILELKTVKEFSAAHYAQARSYLKATKADVALLVNFAGERAEWRRIEY